MRTNIYHLTPSKKASKILQEGIKADDEGNIFTFIDMVVANEIAKHQVFTKQYTVFKIKRQGITGKIEKDNVAEFTAPFHRIIKQKHIEPKYLKLVCEQDTIFDKPTQWDYLVGARLDGLTKEQVDKRFEVFNWIHEQEEKDILSHDAILEEANKRLKNIRRATP